MMHVVLLCIAVVSIAFSWFLYRRNFEMFLCLLLAVYMEFFYLLPKTAVAGNLKLMLLPILGILLADKFFRGKLVPGRYGFRILAFALLSFMGVVVAAMYGQDLLLGIKAAKLMPLILVYFLLVSQEINHERFAKYFIIMALVIAVLVTLQSGLHGKLTIFRSLPDYYISERLGRVRITIGQYLIAVAMVMAFVRYVQTSRLLYAGAAILLLLEVVLIQQTRIFILGLAMSMTILYVILKGVTFQRVFLLLFCASLLGSLWYLTPDLGIENIGLIKATSTDVAEKRGSYQARLNAFQYYWNEIEKRPLLGRGIFNLNWEENKEMALQRMRGIYLADIGITHFIVSSGVVGLLWFVFSLFSFWKDIFRFPQCAHISAYIVLATCVMATIDMFLLNETIFLFATFLGLLSNAIGEHIPVTASAGV